MTLHDPHRSEEPDPMADRLAKSRSLPALLTKLFRDITDLFLKEGELIRSEMRDKITQLQVGVGKVAAGAIVLLVALIVLSDAVVLAVADLLGTLDPSTDKTGWASLIVGGVLSGIGAFLVRSGTTDLDVDNLTPDRTAMQLRRDTEAAKDQMR